MRKGYIWGNKPKSLFWISLGYLLKLIQVENSVQDSEYFDKDIKVEVKSKLMTLITIELDDSLKYDKY